MSVAVAVPFFRARLEPDERVSLRHLDAYLGGYDRYLVGPHGVEAPADLPVERFDARWFASHRRYSELMLSPGLYERFRAYDYVLVHQLDALVLRDELHEWCERGHDYVGAPWVRRDSAGRPFFAGVGNGGFSLRRVQAFLDVLRVASRPRVRAGLGARHAAAVARRIVSRRALAARYRYEDKFWSEQAPRLVPGFDIPPAETAAAFAFETEPRFCFEQNAQRLPFGAHSWARDRAFWEPYLL